MAEVGLELTIPPGAVRNHEVEKTPLLARFLLLEEAAGVSGQFEKPNALGHVGLVCLLVLFDEPQAVGLLLPPVGGQPFERRRVDVAVQFVDVHGVQAILQSGMIGLKVLDGLVVGLALVVVALSQGGPDPVEDFRYIVAWILRTSMQASDVTETLDLARASTGVDQVQVKHRPRLLSDNGPCYVSQELATYLDTHGLGTPAARPITP